MPTKLIRLEDGTLVEVEARPDEIEPISSRRADRVDKALDRVRPVLVQVCRHVGEAARELGDSVRLEGLEVEVGLGFEGEGNVYVTKSKVSANLTVRLQFRPPGGAATGRS